MAADVEVLIVVLVIVIALSLARHGTLQKVQTASVLQNTCTHMLSTPLPNNAPGEEDRQR